MDVRAPTSGGPWPLVVLLPGGPDRPGKFRSPEPLARLLAGQGAVVMNTAWRQGAGDGGGYPTSFADIACAIGVARKTGPAYGAAPDRVILVGHSLGGWAGAVVALTPTEFTPADGSCDPTTGSLRPDAFVGVAAASDLLTAQQAGPDWVREFLGGDRATRPGAWAAADPFALATHHPAGDRALPILLVHGEDDGAVNPATSSAFDATLRAADYDSRLVMIASADHGSILAAPETVEAVMALVDDR